MERISFFFNVEDDPYYQIGICIGVEKGLEKGLKISIEVAQAMKREGLPTFQITRITKLSPEEIEKL